MPGLGNFVGILAHGLLAGTVAVLMLATASLAILFTLACAPPLARLKVAQLKLARRKAHTTR